MRHKPVNGKVFVLIAFVLPVVLILALLSSFFTPVAEESALAIARGKFKTLVTEFGIQERDYFAPTKPTYANSLGFDFFWGPKKEGDHPIVIVVNREGRLKVRAYRYYEALRNSYVPIERRAGSTRQW